MIIVHTAIAILAVVLLIIALRVDPVISLVVGSLYLGIASGLGAEKTVATIIDGFGGIMTEIGLLIGFGVLIGSLLFSLEALQRFVRLLLDGIGARRLPYVLSVVLSAIFPPIYPDAQHVLAAPLVRTAAPYLGRNGLALMAGAQTAGSLVGLVFVVPGLVVVSIAGLLDVPLGTMLVYGLLVGPPTAVLTTYVYSRLLKLGFWNPDKDELDSREPTAEEEPGTTADNGGDRKVPSLLVSLLPVLVPLVMIAFGAIADTAGHSNDVIATIGNPTFALFVGLAGAIVIARTSIGLDRTEQAMRRGLNTTGQILLITGVGGSLGTMIGETDLDKVLGGVFSAESGTPVVVSILLAWFITMVLHLAIGSITVSAITSAGILGPIIAGLDVPTAIIGLAIASGSLFAVHVNSNGFWMIQTLLGLSTRGTLKMHTVVTALSSLVSLPLIIILGLIA